MPRAPEFLESYAATHRFRLGRPASFAFTADGAEVLFLRSGPRSFVRDLWSYEVATGVERVLLTSAQVLGGAEESLSPEERARRERLRLADRGITSFSFAPDGVHLLVPLSGRLFLVDRRTLEVKEIPSAGGPPMDPRFSPDGRELACVRDGELWLHELGAGTERRLTTREGPTVSWGLPEFVAQEEMGRHRGYWWSPDGTKLLAQRTDVAGVETLYILDPLHPERAPSAAPYPRAGGVNALVSLELIELATGARTPLEWDRERWPYVASVRWDAGPLTVVLQDRRQHELAIALADLKTGALRVIHLERDDRWINLDQEMPRWLDAHSFLWTTERDGAWTLERRAADGSLIHRITPPELGYAGLVGVDVRAGTLVVRASVDPIELHALQLPLDPAAGGRLTLTEGRGQHALFLGPRGLRVHTRHTLEGEWDARLIGADGAVLGEIGATAEEPPFVPKLAIERVGARQLATVTLRPRDFDPRKKYPVIVNVYGGPHARMVSAAPYDYLLPQWIADQGFVVVSIDGRGTPGLGREFERAIRGSFVDVPLADQVEALEALFERHPELDRTRVGIYGWSFGGYLSAMAALLRPDVFHAAVAGAPVTDWLDYDTHYTERYLGLPEEAPEAYARSSCLTHASRLERPLLLIHGTSDDNVYLMHSMKLSDALFRAGRRHELLPLANFTHMVPDPLVTSRLYGLIVDHFTRALGVL